MIEGIDMTKNKDELQKTVNREIVLQQMGLMPKPLPKKTIDKIKSGRPSKYRPEFCSKLIDIMAQGKSKTTALLELGISVKTFYDWITEYFEDVGEDGKLYRRKNTNFKPSFLKALKMGEELNLSWWEEMGRLNITNKDFNSTLYMMQMQNRHGWSRRIDGKIDINETHREIKEIVFKFDPEEIKEYVEELKQLSIGLDGTGAIEVSATEVH